MCVCVCVHGACDGESVGCMLAVRRLCACVGEGVNCLCVGGCEVCLCVGGCEVCLCPLQLQLKLANQKWKARCRVEKHEQLWQDNDVRL